MILNNALNDFLNGVFAIGKREIWISHISRCTDWSRGQFYRFDYISGHAVYCPWFWEGTRAFGGSPLIAAPIRRNTKWALFELSKQQFRTLHKPNSTYGLVQNLFSSNISEFQHGLTVSFSRKGVPMTSSAKTRHFMQISAENYHKLLRYQKRN